MLEKVSKHDWQYLIPFLTCTIIFVITDFLGIIEKTYFSYWSGRLIYEPYRALTSHFLHGDVNHLLANCTGIIVVRYFFRALGLKSDYFLFALMALIIPLQTFFSWYLDIFVFKNPMSLSIGFSGILFGFYAFILLTTIYGKKKFFFIKCELKKDHKLFKSIALLTGLGVLWSFLPGISLIGHMTGILAGLVIFII